MIRLEHAQARLLRSLPLGTATQVSKEAHDALRAATQEALRRIDALLDNTE